MRARCLRSVLHGPRKTDVRGARAGCRGESGAGMTPNILVYVAGRFSATDRAGVERNIAAAVAVGLEVARLGACPMIPHANTAHPDFEHVQPYEFWIAATREQLRRCNALITVPGWEASSGARGEVAEAISCTIPTFHSPDELKAWLQAKSGRA